MVVEWWRQLFGTSGVSSRHARAGWDGPSTVQELQGALGCPEKRVGQGSCQGVKCVVGRIPWHVPQRQGQVITELYISTGRGWQEDHQMDSVQCNTLNVEGQVRK